MPPVLAILSVIVLLALSSSSSSSPPVPVGAACFGLPLVGDIGGAMAAQADGDERPVGEDRTHRTKKLAVWLRELIGRLLIDIPPSLPPRA
jgi:hypothetical protein